MAEVRVDVVLGNAVLDDVGAQVADLEDLSQAVFAHILLDLLQVMADARHDLPAIAAGAAKAQVARLQHNNVGDTFSASSRAVLMPEKPPPITTTSASISCSSVGKPRLYFLVAV